MRPALPGLRRRSQCQRCPQIEPVTRLEVGSLAHEREFAREHTDNRIAGVVERERLSNGIGVSAEIAQPCGVTEDDHLIAAGAVFFWQEVAAYRHANS